MDCRKAEMSTGGEVANALVCKTSIHGFKSHPVLHINQSVTSLIARSLGPPPGCIARV
jgi:hypothetical protein